MRKGFVFAMEEDQATDAPVEGVSPAAAEVEANDAEISEQSGDVVDLSEDTDGAAIDAETLGGVQDVMADTVASGDGLSEDAAEVAEVVIESICARLGIKTSRVMPATESFGSKNSRLAATKIAMEGITDKIKTIWEAIVKGFKTMMQKISDFFHSFFNSLESLKKYATDLKSKANALGADMEIKESDKEIKNGGLAQSLNGNANDVLKQQTELLKILPTSINKLNELANSVANKAGTLLTMDSFADSIKNAVPKVEVTGLVYGDSITLQSKTDDVGVEFVKKESEEAKKIEKLTTLNKSQIITLCDEVSVLVKSLEDVKKITDKQKATSGALVKAGEAVIKSFEADIKDVEDNAKAKQNITDIKKLATSLNSASNSLITYVPTSTSRACKAALNYANASIGAHTKKEAAKK